MYIYIYQWFQYLYKLLLRPKVEQRAYWLFLTSYHQHDLQPLCPTATVPTSHMWYQAKWPARGSHKGAPKAEWRTSDDPTWYNGRPWPAKWERFWNQRWTCPHCRYQAYILNCYWRGHCICGEPWHQINHWLLEMEWSDCCVYGKKLKLLQHCEPSGCFIFHLSLPVQIPCEVFLFARALWLFILKALWLLAM